MAYRVEPRRSAFAGAIFNILDPIPYGCFVAALVFDIVYFRTGYIMWVHAAAWLLALGLVAAIVPRLINLVQVWITARAVVTGADRLDFLLNLVAIVIAIVNSFVHSRDAFGAMPEGMWLSAITVVLLTIGRGVVAARAVR